tara:strand:+ start:5793 stop:6530 length:738 start_codon:yes stop_codon:yes gene_type:complete
MKKTLYIVLFIFGTSVQLFSQETLLSPANNTANKNYIKSESYVMSWFMLADTRKIEIGSIQTQIQKGKETINIITTVNMKQSPAKWIDSTIVAAQSLKPLYHSSYNQQRDMVLKFGQKVTGYYLDKQTATKTQISEESNQSYFDSNFYPQLLRLLPLKEGYSNTISIFDYNPKAKTGVLKATIKSTENTTINFNGEEKQVWKVTATDDLSNNTAITTYYIEKTTRQLLKQEMDFGGRKMLMELVE